MRFEPGFVKELQRDIESVRPEIRKKLLRPGALSEERLLSLVCSTPPTWDSDLEHADERAVTKYDDLVTWQSGCDAIRAGEVAFVVLSGGAGTRAGGPKAFMRLPKLGITLMANKLFQ